jgi:hypothetical protein
MTKDFSRNPCFIRCISNLCVKDTEMINGNTRNISIVISADWKERDELMTLLDYMEMQLLYNRRKILDQQWDMIGDDCQSEFLETDFALKEVSDINSIIDTLGVIRRMYAGE